MSEQKPLNHFTEEGELSGFCLEHHFGLSSILLAEGMQNLVVTCDLLIRDFPPHRNFLMAGGLERVIDFLENIKYSDKLIKHLLKNKLVSPQFTKYLKDFSFSGDVHALPEGTVHFPGEPMIRVTAPIIESNLITDQLIALVNIDTLLLSKLARVKLAAGEKMKCNVGFVRAQGIDAGWRATRNSRFFDDMGHCHVSSSLKLGIESGAGVLNANHAFIKSFPTELEALRAAVRSFPDTIAPMVDTYEVKQGIRNAITIADELKKYGKHLPNIVIDSGDFLALSKYARRELDKAGHQDTEITIAGNLDEYKISKLIKAGIPADRCLMVTEVVTSADAPKLEVVYKMAEIKDESSTRYTAKLSSGKVSLPGKKQVFRQFKNGKIKKDTIGLDDEKHGQPLLVPIFKKGQLVYKIPTIEKQRQYTRQQLAQLPANLKDIFKEYKSPVVVSKKIQALLEKVRSQHVT